MMKRKRNKRKENQSVEKNALKNSQTYFITKGSFSAFSCTNSSSNVFFLFQLHGPILKWFNAFILSVTLHEHKDFVCFLELYVVYDP